MGRAFRLSVALLLGGCSLLLAGCSPEQSKSIGAQPKKAIDKASADMEKAMQQGAQRLEGKD